MTVKELRYQLLGVPEMATVYVCDSRSNPLQGEMVPLRNFAGFYTGVTDTEPFALLVADALLLPEEESSDGGAVQRPEGRAKGASGRKKEAGKAKKGIDKGKIVALAGAGWKADDIAKEVGCSVTTVRATVKDVLYGNERKSEDGESQDR